MYDEWTVELKAMINRIIDLRRLLYDALHDRGKSTRLYDIMFALVGVIDSDLVMPT